MGHPLLTFLKIGYNVLDILRSNQCFTKEGTMWQGLNGTMMIGVTVAVSFFFVAHGCTLWWMPEW